MNDCQCGERPYREERKLIDQKLGIICETISKESDKHNGIWNAINRRVPYYVFFTVLGGLFLITVGLMGITYTQGKDTQSVVMEVRASQAGMASMISANTDKIDDIKTQIDKIDK